MSITIDEMSTEVVAEPATRRANGADTAPAEALDELTRLRFALAMAARLEQRLAAEGYDD